MTTDTELSDDAIARYLRAHPDYFQRHPGLLALLELPHATGATVSLVERQVAILRERNIDMRKRFTQLVGTANTNDGLFDKTRALTLALLDANSLRDLDDVIAHSLKSGFKADAVTCFVSHPNALPTLEHIRYCASAQQLPMLQLTQSTGTACGPLRSDEFARLFAGEGRHEGSAAIVQLRHADLVGVLAIGSHDPQRFSADMGTLFVRFIGDVFARVLNYHLRGDGGN